MLGTTTTTGTNWRPSVALCHTCALSASRTCTLNATTISNRRSNTRGCSAVAFARPWRVCRTSRTCNCRPFRLALVDPLSLCRRCATSGRTPNCTPCRCSTLPCGAATAAPDTAPRPSAPTSRCANCTFAAPSLPVTTACWPDWTPTRRSSRFRCRTACCTRRNRRGWRGGCAPTRQLQQLALRGTRLGVDGPSHQHYWRACLWALTPHPALRSLDVRWCSGSDDNNINNQVATSQDKHAIERLVTRNRILTEVRWCHEEDESQNNTSTNAIVAHALGLNRAQFWQLSQTGSSPTQWVQALAVATDQPSCLLDILRENPLLCHGGTEAAAARTKTSPPSP